MVEFSFQVQAMPLECGTGSGTLFRGAMPWGLHSSQARDDYQNLLQLHKIQTVVVLVTKEELEFASESLHPNALEFYQSRNIKTIHYPMEDGGAPSSDESFDSLITDLVERLKKGENVLVHCMGGIGRTGLVISCLAKKTIVSTIVSKRDSKPFAKGRVKVISDTENDFISTIALSQVRILLPKAVETKEQKQYLTKYLKYPLEESSPEANSPSP